MNKEVKEISPDSIYAVDLISKKKAKKPIVKNMSLTAAILTVIFMILVVIYQLTSSQRSLADDLTVVFAKYHK